MASAGGLLGCRRGSMAVEAVVLIPLLVLFWQIATVLHGLNSQTTRQTEETRSCAWRYAVRGCEQVPPECQIRNHGELDGAILEAETGLAFGMIGSELPFLRDTLDSKHGLLIEAHRESELANPLWDDIPIESEHRVMCNTPTLEWTEPDVVSEACRRLAGPWCP